MSGIGNQKVDGRGRSGPRKTNGAMKIDGPFVAHRLEMLTSPAYRTLSLSALRVLARLEVEHMGHAGRDNGTLPCTYNDFVEHGVHRQAIGPAINECVALGFLKVTEHGRSGNGAFRSANKFRLTYLATRGVAPSDDWDAIDTEEEAERIAEAARSLRRSLRARSRAARVVQGSKIIESGTENVPENNVHSSTENVLQIIPTSTETNIGEWRKPALAFQILEGDRRRADGN